MNLEHALTVAHTAADSARVLLRKRYEEYCSGHSGIAVSTKSSARDFVTSVDGECQAMLVDMIHREFPDHRFLAEEEGAEGIGDPACPWRWILDPLDGTLNFVRRKPTFGCLIALENREGLQLGIIELPLSSPSLPKGGGKGEGSAAKGRKEYGERFWAMRDGGAHWSHGEVHLRNTQDLMDSVLSSNLIHRAKSCAGGVLHIATTPCASLENCGCAAEEFAAVLRGHSDGIFYDGAGYWDIAAGCMVLAEAGGMYRSEFIDPGNHKKGIQCVASTAAIFPELEKFLFRNNRP